MPARQSSAQACVPMARVRALTCACQYASGQGMIAIEIPLSCR